MIGTAEHRIIFIVTWPVDIPEALILTVLQPSHKMSLISRDESLVSQEGGNLLF